MIFGLAFAVLFFGTVRVLSLVEGRIIEVMLGERMPRRPVDAERGKPVMTRIKEMFTDPRSWSTLLYLILKLPLGIAGFVIVTVGIALSLGLMAAPVACLLVGLGVIDGEIRAGGDLVPPIWLLAPLAFVAGTLLLFATLHVARGLGRLHAVLAKPLLVQRAGPAPTE
jgi:hypothetical protein